MIKRCLRYAGIVLCMSVIGLVLLTLVFSFDNPLIDQHIAEALPLLPTDKWTGYGRLGAFRGAWLDTPTENIMMQKSSLEAGKSALYNALSMKGYERYWHGYVLVLRPLLRFLPLSGIYMVNRVIFYVLLVWMLVLLGKRTAARVPVFLVLAMAPAFFFLIPICMQFLSVFLIAFAASIFVLSKVRKRETLRVLFVIIGALTSYFDFLTAPQVTLTIPLCMILLVRIYGQKNRNVKDTIIEVILYAMLWAFGYFGMWFMKWVLASLFLHRNIIAASMENARFRVDTGNISITRWQAVQMNLETYLSEYLSVLVIPLCAVLVIVSAAVCVKNPAWIPLIVVEVMPFAWFMILSNHTAIHCFMTYRTLIPSAFIVLLMIDRLLCGAKGRTAHD